MARAISGNREYTIMAEEMFSDFTYLGDFVAKDPDLVTFYELSIRGFTTDDRVSPMRERRLIDYDHEQLVADLSAVYGIDRAQAINAEQLCIVAIYNQMQDQGRLLYGE